MEDLNSILPFVPEQYRPNVSTAILVTMLAGRVIQSIRTGGGLKGMLASIWLGTSVPKDLTARVATLEKNTDTIIKP